MDIDEPRRLAQLGFDEKTETFFVQPQPEQRLTLTRPSLARLVEMYNSIHQGLPLVLIEERELARIEEIRQWQAAMLRELEAHAERRRAGALAVRVRRLARALARRCAVLTAAAGPRRRRGA